jgi:hypothetical protein
VAREYLAGMSAPRSLVLPLLLSFPLLEPRTGADDVLLPPGREAELVARLVARGAQPAAPPRGWPAWEDRSASGWGGEAPWRDWVELLRAESAGAPGDADSAARRARLALLAVVQGRGADAWAHLLACGDDPVVLTLLPALLPGVPVEHLGEPGPLPAGVTLRPVLPPPRPDARGPASGLEAVAGQVMEHQTVRIGETVVGLRVLIEGDGVQVDVTHRSGPAVDVTVLPPVPSGVDIGLLYADWTEIAQAREAVPFTVAPGDAAHTIWGRFLGRPARLPAPVLAPGAPRPRGDLRVVVPEARAGEALLSRFAEALSELFDRPALVTTDALDDRLDGAGGDATAPPFEPIAIRIEDGAAGEEKLVAMIAMIERLLLDAPSTD